MPTESNILRKDWNEVRKVLKNSKGNGNERSTTNPEERSLREHFGNEKFELLRGFAQEADKTRKELGNVILLPGIMGSSLLSVDANGEESSIWLTLRSLAFGRLRQLELAPDGKTNLDGTMIKTPGVFSGLFRGFMFDYYGLALESLQAEPFSYDWRLDVRTSAQNLAEFIRQKFFGQQVSLVAHSMGGLVARSFIFQFPDLWEIMQGKLVMLGTPNHGSFDAVQALIGENRTIKKLDIFDICNNKEDLMRIFHSFPGLYQLLPAKDLVGEIYQKTTWDNYPTVRFATHLTDVERFHRELTSPSTIDNKRMFYIAGTGFETLFGLKSINNGVFDFETTSDGDGTVPHNLGLLDGITTFYDTENEHSDLLNGLTNLQAVRDLIKDGKTDKLPIEKPAQRGASRGAKTSDISPEEEELIEVIIGAERSGEMLDPEQVAEVERKLHRAIMGGKEEKKTKKDEKKPPAKKIRLELWEKDISEITEPIIVVGKYSDLPPRGASASIDKKLGYRISLTHQAGMIGAELGQLFFVPQINGAANNSQPVDETQKIILAGGGSYAKFSRDDLRYLMMNVALAVLSLNQNRFTTVMIGTGLDDFSIDRAVRSLLSGVADAIDRFPNSTTKEMTVAICEFNPIRFDNLAKVVSELNERQKKNAPIDNVELLFDEKDKHGLNEKEREAKKSENQETRKKSAKESDVPYYVLNESQRNVTRITVERNPDKERFLLSALTSTAAIPQREIIVQNCIIDSLIEKARRSRDAEKQQKYGRLMHSMLIPEEFQSLIDGNKPLVLQLNPTAAAIPWEMVCFGGSRGFSTFGVELQLSRQFSMLSASIPSVPPPLNNTLKVLIIANPADGDLSLDGAEREGRELQAFFEQLQSKTKVKITVDACIGASQCDIVDVLTKIFSEEYDIIHFSGHGNYDPNDETNSGWVFGTRKVKIKEGNNETEVEKLLVLSPREIFRLRKVPRLVFANACFSSQTSEGEILINERISAQESTRKLAGIAEAFFSRGIENYIGAGWQVNDSLAVAFAKEFYERALSKEDKENRYLTLSEALREAREVIKNKADNSTWGAYQHYGDANTRLAK